MRRKFGPVAVTVAVAVLAAGTVTAAQSPDPKAAALGRRLYATYKCDKCHTIAGRGTKKKNGELDDVGNKLTAAEIRSWLTTPADMEAKLQNPPKGTDAMSNALKTKGIQPGEINDLVAYLQTLKKK
jgi:cytochrome c2